MRPVSSLPLFNKNKKKMLKSDHIVRGVRVFSARHVFKLKDRPRSTKDEC